MIKSIVKALAKKYIISAIQEVVEAKKERVVYYTGLVGVWILRLKKAVEFLEGIVAKLDDGKITDEEADAVLAEAEKLVKEW